MDPVADANWAAYIELLDFFKYVDKALVEETAREWDEGSSGSAPVRMLLSELWEHEGTQFLAARVTSAENSWADRLSRGDVREVLREVRELGWRPHARPVGMSALRALRSAVSLSPPSD